MSDTRVARIFKNGASQAVRLPAEFRFDRDSVFVRRQEGTGDVILSTRPAAPGWDAFFALMDTVEVPDDFMADRPANVVPQERDLFGEE